MPLIGLLLCLALTAGCTQTRSYSAAWFGAAGDGQTKETRSIQLAIDRCAERGGGEVRIPKGTHVTGSLDLKSNVALRLEEGATLRGSPDLADYPLTRARWEGRWVSAHRALVSARNAHHIAIVGPGRIVGDPTIGGRQMPRRPPVVETIDCDDVVFDGFRAEQARMWTLHPTRTDHVVARHLTLRSNTGNGDGIDLDSCRHVLIEDCDIATGDDCIALKSGRGMEGLAEARPTEDVLIRRCALADPTFACIGIGSEMSGSVRNVRIEDTTFQTPGYTGERPGSRNAFSIYIKSRPGRGGVIENISGSNLTVKSAAAGFLRINMLSSGIQDPSPVEGDAGIPLCRGISFDHVTLERCALVAEAVQIPPTRPLEGLALAHVAGNASAGISLNNVRDARLEAIRVEGIRTPVLSVANATGRGLEGAAEYRPATRPVR